MSTPFSDDFYVNLEPSGAAAAPGTSPPRPPADPIVESVKAIADEVRPVVAGEYVELRVENSEGAIRIHGRVSSLAMFKRLEERTSRMKSIKGVKSIDISGVEHPGW